MTPRKRGGDTGRASGYGAQRGEAVAQRPGGVGSRNPADSRNPGRFLPGVKPVSVAPRAPCAPQPARAGGRAKARRSAFPGGRCRRHGEQGEAEPSDRPGCPERHPLDEPATTGAAIRLERHPSGAARDAFALHSKRALTRPAARSDASRPSAARSPPGPSCRCPYRTAARRTESCSAPSAARAAGRPASSRGSRPGRCRSAARRD